jgi:excisionase family DNA binding protein
MLARPRRPREKRVVPATRFSYSIAEFCAITGLSRAAVFRSIEDGSLRAIKVGSRRLILARQPRVADSWRVRQARKGCRPEPRF